MAAEYTRKIVLENGREFYGYGFGAKAEAVNEIVFNTSMVGYQEILSDPKVKVKDVAEQVGIDNKQYFFMLFKQMTGVTPKQYQIQLRDS